MYQRTLAHAIALAIVTVVLTSCGGTEWIPPPGLAAEAPIPGCVRLASSSSDEIRVIALGPHSLRSRFGGGMEGAGWLFDGLEAYPAQWRGDGDRIELSVRRHESTHLTLTLRNGGVAGETSQRGYQDAYPITCPSAAIAAAPAVRAYFDLPAGAEEIRITRTILLNGQSYMLRLINDSGKASGMLFSGWGPIIHSSDALAALPLCRTDSPVSECRVVFDQEPDWMAIHALLDTLQVGRLPDAADLGIERNVMDGADIRVEAVNAAGIRSYGFNNPRADRSTIEVLAHQQGIVVDLLASRTRGTDAVTDQAIASGVVWQDRAARLFELDRRAP